MKKIKIKICHKCGKEYTTRGNKYCSVKCRNVINARMRTRHERLNSPLIQFIIDYLTIPGYIKAKNLAYEYIKVHRPELRYNDADREIEQKRISGKISGYFRVLTAEGYDMIKWNRGKPHSYKITEGMIQGFKDLKAGKYFPSFYKRRFNYKIDLLNYDWRLFKELEKTEILNYNNRLNAKMHFLGTVDKVDPHFLELFNAQNQQVYI